jgi:hypothetical protein
MMVAESHSQESENGGGAYTAHEITVDPNSSQAYGLVITTSPVVTWSIYIFGKGDNNLVINITSNPNWFHRLTTSLIFGWHWVKAPI